jgi:CelD/BcsL family acetyltransferase involved in cellulose biosynthesis
VATLADRSLPALERADELDSLCDVWAELAERSGSVFATWEWQSLWWEHFGRDRELLLTAARDSDGRIEAILPFYVWRARPLRIVRVLGHGPGDELAPIGERGASEEALGRWAAGERFDLLVCQQLPGPGSWIEHLPGGQVVARTGSPVLDFAGQTWEELLAGKSKNFREQVRRRERSLERAGELRYRLVTGEEGLVEALDTLFRLHRLRWGDGTTFARTESFQREFAAAAAARGWLRLWLLELDGAPAAAWLGFRFAEAECYYQAGRDPALEERSVGFVLLAHTIRTAAADGASEYRFLRGDEPYKYRFATDDPGLETIVVPRGAAGRAALAGLQLLRRVKASVSSRSGTRLDLPIRPR